MASRFGQPQDFQRSIELLKGVPESELSFEALCLLAAQTDVVKDRAAAIHYYRMAIAKRPDVAGPYNNLAVILSSADDTADEGLKLARVALSKDPQNPHILDTIALIQVHMGKYNAAISSMESAVAIDPDVKWKLKLVELQIGANRRLEARTLLKKISSDPKSANSQEIQARIDALKQQLDATATTAPAK